jgi:hypothetical protein
LLGRLGGSDRVITLSFHVDYFNDPWKDPFSDPLYSRREAQYSLIYDKAHKLGKPDYLYFTPLIMVDGRHPLLGSGSEAPGKAKGAVDRSLREPAEVSIELAWSPGGGPLRKELKVAVRSRQARSAGREVLVGVATYEDGLTTKVGAGELKGRTYAGHNTVRKLQVEPMKPGRAKLAERAFPIELESGWDAARCGVVAFAQDEATGRILQVERLSWQAAEEGADSAAR